MVANMNDMVNWRDEQVKYFSEYLKNFEENSKEHKIITQGIKELKDII